MNRIDTLANPQMIVSFICATFGMISFTSAFFEMSADSILAMAVIRLVLGIIYFLGALINIFRGIPAGNLNLIFSVCFGLLAGVNMLMDALQGFLNLTTQPLIYGVMQIFVGLYLLALLPAMRHVPFNQWGAYSCAILGLLAVGIWRCMNWEVFQKIGGIAFLGFALFNFYIGFWAILPYLPPGPSLSQMSAWLKARKTGRE